MEGRFKNIYFHFVPFVYLLLCLILLFIYSVWVPCLKVLSSLSYCCCRLCSSLFESRLWTDWGSLLFFSAACRSVFLWSGSGVRQQRKTWCDTSWNDLRSLVIFTRLSVGSGWMWAHVVKLSNRLVLLSEVTCRLTWSSCHLSEKT